MKKLLIIFLAIALNGCDKNGEPRCVGVDCLPPATQTGAGTFGCLINGKPFVDNSNDFNCFYQFINGEYNFGILAVDNVSPIAALGIGSLSKTILLQTAIPLNSRIENEFYAIVNGNFRPSTLITTQANDGAVIFTNLNTTSNTVSGTFEFQVTDNNTGIIYYITEGRFDSRFTR